MKGDYPGQDKEAKKAGEEGLEAIKAKASELVCLTSIYGDSIVVFGLSQTFR